MEGEGHRVFLGETWDLGPEKLSSLENQPAREPADLSPGWYKWELQGPGEEGNIAGSHGRNIVTAETPETSKGSARQ